MDHTVRMFLRGIVPKEALSNVMEILVKSFWKIFCLTLGSNKRPKNRSLEYEVLWIFKNNAVLI